MLPIFVINHTDFPIYTLLGTVLKNIYSSQPSAEEILF